MRPQDPAKTEEDQTKTKKKVNKVKKRLYIEPGTLLSFPYNFYGLKGLNDVWMVYNSTSFVLKLALWATYVGLPIFQHTLRALLTGYSQYNMDVGEILLNFPIHPDLRPFGGVDIAHIKSSPDDE